MKPKEVALLSMTEQSTLIRRKKLSVAELVKLYLDRIERLNPVLNAYITICADEALAQAKRIDASLTKGNKMQGIVLGMPISLKDQFNTKGVLTTNGSLALRDYIPQEDSTVAAKLKEAGAIILGKLNMSEFACGAGEDMPYGTARNPWNTNHSPAGSSSGSGIAVAAGLCAASIGGDTGGSGRAPANVCGVVGYLPSAGLVSRYGIHPLAPSADSATPLTRTVEDTAVLLNAIAGWDPKDPLSSRRPVPDYVASLGGGVKGMRIGVIQELTRGPNLDPEVRAMTQAAVDKLAELGATVDEVSIPQIEFAGLAIFAIAMAEGAAINQKWLNFRLEDFRQSTRLNLLTGYLLPSKVYLRARQAQDIFRARLLTALERCNVLACPTSGALPPTIEETKRTALLSTKEEVVKGHGRGRISNSGMANLAGTPAISVPCGFSRSGLPIGLQIVGRPFEDATVLRVAHTYEQATEWHMQHPNM